MNPTIMVVDDEISMRMLVRHILQRHHFTIIEAENAFAALRLLDEVTPDIFILDYMMPGMNGIELSRELRSRPKTAHIPIILFSALKNMEAATTIDEYLTKITPPGLLVSTIYRLMKVDVVNPR